MKSAYTVAIIFALLSSIQVPFLPELQLILFVSYLIVGKSELKKICFFLLIICTHVYAIPDAVLRLEPSQYPSIYTRSYGPLKLLDILVVSIFIYTTRYIPALFQFKNVNIIFIVLFLCIISSVINAFFGYSDYSYLLFHCRNLLIVISISIWLTKIKLQSLYHLTLLALFTWIMKMLFMILFPTDNVISREIFGFSWYIFFAGDEYLTFGVIIATGLLISSKLKLDIRAIKLRYFYFSLVALFLALISQRKGAIPYFMIVWFMIYLYEFRLISLNRIFGGSLLFSASYMFLFFLLIYSFIPIPIKLIFSEYHTLYVSALDSLSYLFDNNPLQFLVGIGSAGTYKIISLPSYADHIFSFGKEVGNEYRYAIWTIPFGRLILNVGVIGLLILLITFFLNIIKNKSTCSLFLYISLFPFAGMYGLTPVSSVFAGFALFIYSRPSVANTGTN